MSNRTFDELSAHTWFVGAMSRDDAERFLAETKLPFCVRVSKGNLVFSAPVPTRDAEFAHSVIGEPSPGMYSLALSAGGELTAPSVPLLLSLWIKSGDDDERAKRDMQYIQLPPELDDVSAVAYVGLSATEQVVAARTSRAKELLAVPAAASSAQSRVSPTRHAVRNAYVGLSSGEQLVAPCIQADGGSRALSALPSVDEEYEFDAQNVPTRRVPEKAVPAPASSSSSASSSTAAPKRSPHGEIPLPPLPPLPSIGVSDDPLPPPLPLPVHDPNEDYLLALALAAEEEEFAGALRASAAAEAAAAAEAEARQIAAEKVVFAGALRASAAAESSNDFLAIPAPAEDEVAAGSSSSGGSDSALMKTKLLKIGSATVEMFYPEFWSTSMGDTTLTVVPVLKPSVEWMLITTEFHRQAPVWSGRNLNMSPADLDVVRVERIQNVDTWKWYHLYREDVKAKRGDANEKLLFHAAADAHITRTIIEDGFDMRLANEAGSIGAGIYLALSAHTSRAYTTPRPDGYKQMFLVMAVLGVPASQPDESRRRPPKGFDSVGSDDSGQYAVYDNRAAYPAYLITFREVPKKPSKSGKPAW
jgi:hypothetical protein